jgi:predicted dithiol-disulfide oxidoreductase (DUF899 family)
MVAIDKKYVFEGPDGDASLLELTSRSRPTKARRSV